jgi:hypothetical protein
MVISCVIKGFLVHNVLVDTGNAVDIIFAKASDRCKNQRTRFMMLHTLFVASEEDRLLHLAKMSRRLSEFITLKWPLHRKESR